MQLLDGNNQATQIVSQAVALAVSTLADMYNSSNHNWPMECLHIIVSSELTICLLGPIWPPGHETYRIEEEKSHCHHHQQHCMLTNWVAEPA